MPRNGSGTYSRTNGVNSGATTWQLDRDAGTKILASRHDTHDQDIADALTASVAKDGQTTPTANLPMGNFKHTGVADATSRTHYAAYGQMQDNEHEWLGTTAGSSNAFTASLSPAITAYVTGMRFSFLADRANTGASTLNINSVGATAIVCRDGSTALSSGDITSGDVHEVIYDGTSWVLVQASKLVGDLTGNVTGNLTGNVTGNVTGDLTGNVTGNINGTVGAVTPTTGAFTTLTATNFSNASGNVRAGSASLTTSSTDGFFYAPVTAGQPTGTATSVAGYAPLTVDTTNNRVDYYNSGWRTVNPSSIRCLLTKSATQSITVSTNTLVTFDQETFDTNTLHDNVTNNERIILNKVGAWLIFGGVEFTATSAGRYRIFLAKNGSTTTINDLTLSAAASNQTLQVMGIVASTAITDYMTLSAFFGSGTATINNGAQTFFGAVFLGET